MAAEGSGTLPASTPEATAALAQTREGPRLPPEALDGELASGDGVLYTVGPGVERAVRGQPYERAVDDPLYRPLRIFTRDPAESRLEGSIGLVNVPYEPLAPGPVGRVFEVDNRDGEHRIEYPRVDLDDPLLLIRDGRDPSPSDPRFHQQMVYAVCSTVYAAFKAALGRHLAWGFDRTVASPHDPVRLRLRPHARLEENAYYDKENGELAFGYFQAATAVHGANLPRGFIFTSLSHDIVAHEVTHALLDGLRAQFALATGPDVFAFHEAFADLVALFVRFSYEQVVHAAIRRSRGQIEKATMLSEIAKQFGQARGLERALRSAIDAGEGNELKLYNPELESHELGSVLVAAVFEAFTTVFRRKSAVYVRLATGGTGELPPGEIPADLQTVLARRASRLASQFLTMCIRAIDYCPPVDVELGEFLRAIITADRDLVPDDPWAYREAWIDAFRRRQIYPKHVTSLSEDALVWRPAATPVPPIAALSFAKLQFEGDPGRAAGAKELHRQACALGAAMTDARHLAAFGLARQDDPALRGDRLDLPCVHSVRSSRRVGPDGQVVFDLVAEVTQRRVVAARDGSPSFDFHGGATIIIGPRGEVRYVVSKSVLNEERLERQRAFITSAQGTAFWRKDEHGRLVANRQSFKLLHQPDRGERDAPPEPPALRTANESRSSAGATP
jgi:hypothetical protein